MKAYIKNNRIIIKFRYDPVLVDEVKKHVPKRMWNNEGKFWHAPITMDAVKWLQLYNFDMSPELKRLAKDKPQYNPEELKTSRANMITPLLTYQKKGVRFALMEKIGTKGVLIADEPGLGKTAQAIGYIAARPKEKPVLIVCPTSLKINWKNEIKKFLSPACFDKIEILNGTTPEKTTGDILIIGYSTLIHWHDEFFRRGVKLLILDECFPKGIKISTPNGDVPIEKLKKGDKVFNAVGIGEVVCIKKRRTNKVISMHLENGKIIKCTPNHPFFTEEGWVPACYCAGKKIFPFDEINKIINENCYETKSKNMQVLQEKIQNKTEKTKILRDILCSEMEDGATRNKKENIHKRTFKKCVYWAERSTQEKSRMGYGNIKKNEKEQPFHKARSHEKDKKKLGDKWTPSIKNQEKRWEWTRNALASKNSFRGIRRTMECRISNIFRKKKSWISNKLQSRFSLSKEKNMDRNRWMVSSISTHKKIRQKERSEIRAIRVERIEIHKSGNNEVSKDCIVYNLQVSGHPSYFAEGFLVHNCHYVKNPKTQRSIAIYGGTIEKDDRKEKYKGLKHCVDKILALSGTPITNRPVEFFPILNMLDPLQFDNFFLFGKRYCGAKKGRFGWDFSGATNTTELNKKLARVMIRRKKDDVLKQLPDKRRVIVPFELSNRRAYTKAVNDFVSWVRQNDPDKLSGAKNAEALAKIAYLKGLCWEGKKDAIMSWIETFLEADEKIVVFCERRKAIEELRQHFKKYGVVQIHGGIKDKDRAEAVKRFQNDPSVRVFIGQIHAAGEGLTLTASHITITTQLVHVPATHLQAEDRVHRIGQKDSVLSYYAVAERSIEEDLINILKKKMRVLSKVLDGKDIVEQENIFSELLKTFKPKPRLNRRKKK